MPQQSLVPELLSEPLSKELGNFMDSINDNLKFHIFKLISKHMEKNHLQKDGDIELEGKQWLFNTLLIMLTNLGFGLSVKERMKLIENIK